MSNYNDRKNMDLKMPHNPPRILLRMKKKSPVEDDEITAIGIRPETSRMFSPNIRQIEFPQTGRFSERKPERNWNSFSASR